MRPAILASLLLLLLAGCSRDFSPDTYNTQAVQTANKVNQGVVVGVRKVAIRGDAANGATAGAAAGGIVGSQIGKGTASALSTLAGTVTGGLVGATAERTTEDTFGWEYVVRKSNGDLLSVTQKDMAPLDLGTHVLLIEGPQARIVRDYTVKLPEPNKEETKKDEAPPPQLEKQAEKPAEKPSEPQAVPKDGAP